MKLTARYEDADDGFMEEKFFELMDEKDRDFDGAGEARHGDGPRSGEGARFREFGGSVGITSRRNRGSEGGATREGGGAGRHG